MIFSGEFVSSSVILFSFDSNDMELLFIPGPSSFATSKEEGSDYDSSENCEKKIFPNSRVASVGLDVSLEHLIGWKCNNYLFFELLKNAHKREPELTSFFIMYFAIIRVLYKISKIWVLKKLLMLFAQQVATKKLLRCQ